jgi:signal transduction histidine kinase/DNA-binding response OmpR family regulator
MNLWFPKVWRRLQPFIPGLLIGGVVAGLLGLGVWVPLENLASNGLMRLRGPQSWDDRLVVIGIDDETLRYLGQFPLTRDYYGRLVQKLAAAQTAVVAFDLLLVDPSPEDGLLAQAMIDHGAVVLAQAWGADDLPILPQTRLLDSAIATGHIRQPIDADNVVRRVELFAGGVPALSVATAQAYSLVADSVSVPPSSQLLLNWPGPVSGVSYVSLKDVLSDRVAPKRLAHKIALVGLTATGVGQWRTPFDVNRPVAGVYVHAAALNNLLHQNWLQTLPVGRVAIALLLVGPIFSWGIQRSPFSIQIAAWLGVSSGWVLLCGVALTQNYVLPIVPPLMMFGLTVGAIAWIDRLRANALLQARDRFLSTMSHEIRTPLNAIIGVSEMLQETSLTPEQQDLTETIEHSSQTLLALINDVLDFSKIEAGKLTLEQQPVNLRSCIEQTLEIIAPRAALQHLELVYALDPAAPLVIITDPVRLRQILLNLLSNAVKFTGQGEVALRVHALTPGPDAQLDLHKQPPLPPRRPSKAATGCTIQFSVRDTGIGIPPDRLHRLFQPFSQVSAATAREYGGTGLGLAISKHLAESMGGQLWVTSQVGQGSEFSFTIQAIPEPVTHPRLRPESLLRWQGRRCLIIDQNRTRRLSLTWQLQALAVESMTAHSVAEALVLLQQGQQFSGVIMNVARPRSETISDILTLRQSAEAPQWPFILMTALGETGSSEWPDGTTVLRKPIKQAALYRTLMQLAPWQADQRDTPQPGAPCTQSDRQALTVAPIKKAPLLSHPLKILIAEDNAVNQKVARRMLELLGYQPDVVGTGTEVLNALRRQTYDVILMDIRMPEMDGLEATRRIRQQGQTSPQPWIIAITANAILEDRHRCLAAGMNDYLSKPIRRDSLAQALLKAASPIN